MSYEYPSYDDEQQVLRWPSNHPVRQVVVMYGPPLQDGTQGHMYYMGAKSPWLLI